MKVGIIGVGAVGSACAIALMQRGSAREIVLVDKTRARARAVALDMRYGAPVSPTADVRDGSYDDLKGADLVLITAGVNEKSGGATDRSDAEGRLKLLDANVSIYQEIVPQVVTAAPEALLVIVTDPPDPLADLTRHLAGHDRVISTGTVIDSLRFRVHLADRLGLNPASVEAMAIGEHGTSEVLLWSSATVAGLPIQDACQQCGEPFEKVREAVERDVRFANITIIEGNNASQYGIGIVCARGNGSGRARRAEHLPSCQLSTGLRRYPGVAQRGRPQRHHPGPYASDVGPRARAAPAQRRAPAGRGAPAAGCDPGFVTLSS